MRIGFTGTSKGMTAAQKLSFTMLLDNPERITEFHHGDCVGADQQADWVVANVFRNNVRIEVHPPSDPKSRAFCDGRLGIGSRIVHQEKPYLTRNHEIVDATDLLIATPYEWEEKVRSGTWATVRYAQKKGKKIVMIYPGGSYAVFHGFENVA